MIEKLNQAFGKDVSDADQVALAVHVSEKLRDNAIVMAQIPNNPKDQAMKSNLPGAAVDAIVGAMSTHQKLATHLLSEEGARREFLDVIYELLARDFGANLLAAARNGSGAQP